MKNNFESEIYFCRYHHLEWLLVFSLFQLHSFWRSVMQIGSICSSLACAKYVNHQFLDLTCPT